MTNDKVPVKVQSLSLGLDEKFKRSIASALSLLDNRDLSYDMDQLLELKDVNPALVFCAPPPESVSPIEVAQLLRMKFPQVLIYFVANSDFKFDRKNYIKNGFTDVFFFPIDQNHFDSEIEGQISQISGMKHAFRPVKLIDLTVGTVLDFDTYIYLPVNNKHIRFTEKGQQLDAKRLKQLKSHSVSSLFVEQSEMPVFYDYTAKVLKKLSTDQTLSETERTEKLKAAIREIITSLFSDTLTGTDGGKKIVEDCQSIVKNYISTGRTGKIYEQLLALSGSSGGTYSNIAAVSTYATLFAIGLGLKTVDEVALSGLLYDVGLAMVPPEILKKDKSQWNQAERTEYERHPEHSIQIIKDRKLVLPDLIYKIVSQHHERYDGKGFPKKLMGSKICVEAQILSFADAFNEMTASVPGRISLTPEKAVQFFRENMRDPGISMIDPAMLKKILELFSPDVL